ncbi:MAG: hypothetical protein WED05_10510 [Candidatus Atabeyarchaeum deiterrae]
MTDLGILDATLGECGEVVLLAIMDGARKAEQIQAITGLRSKLVATRLRVLVDLKLIFADALSYVLTEEGLKLARIVAQRRNLGESECQSSSVNEDPCGL